MSQEELDALCLEWQRRLRLQDWRVVVKIVPRYEVVGNWGETSRNKRHKTAVIRLADLNGSHDVINDEIFAPSVEEVLVHELLHLTIAGFDVTDDEGANAMVREAQEEAINMIAAALVYGRNAGSVGE